MSEAQGSGKLGQQAKEISRRDILRGAANHAVGIGVGFALAGTLDVTEAQAAPTVDWEADKRFLHCPCHGSEFASLDHAQNQPGSPAQRSLPQLPLETTAEGPMSAYPAVESSFRTTVGCGPVRH